jgi:hypothetical protein
MTYKSISVKASKELPEEPIKLSELKYLNFYSSKDKMVFFGHYWLEGPPAMYKNNVCCLDYSVAKEGKLVAYSLDDERILDKNKFIAV